MLSPIWVYVNGIFVFARLCGCGYLDRGWWVWVTLVVLGCFGSASRFQLSLLLWVPIAKGSNCQVYKGVLAFGLRLKMKGCMEIVFC